MKPTEAHEPPSCRICRFAERRGYTHSCAWSEGDLCQPCADTAEVLAKWLHRATWRAKGALWRLAEDIELECEEIEIKGKETNGQR